MLCIKLKSRRHRNKKKSLQKIEIGLPTDFKIIQHIGLPEEPDKNISNVKKNLLKNFKLNFFFF